MLQIQAQPLTDYIDAIFRAAGAPAEHATFVADALVAANLAGHDSHGVIRTQQYLAAIRKGDLDPAAAPEITRETAVLTLLDGRRSFGQVAARVAMAAAIAKAHAQGLAASGLYNSGHVGRVGQWVEMAANQGMIGLAFVNGGRAGGLVAPHQGAARRFGTNPFAAAVPRADAPPIVIDFATSVSAEGKIRVAYNAGKPVPPGRILDVDGRPSTNPADLYAGGMLLPLGEHKGYCLALLMDLLGGILTGSGASSWPVYNSANGALFLVLDVGAFRPLTEFLTDAAGLSTTLKETPPAQGYEEVLIPGEPELRNAALRRTEGIPLDETTWSELAAAATEFGIAVPDLL